MDGLDDSEKLFQLWMIYTSKTDPQALQDYIQLFVDSYSQLVDVDLNHLNEGFSESGPHLTKLPDGILQVLGNQLNQCCFSNDLATIATASNLIKCLIIICRNHDNVPLVASCEFTSYTVNIATAVVEKIKDDYPTEELEAYILFLKLTLHFYECLYDPYFLWRKRMLGWNIENTSTKSKPALLHVEVIPFFHDCFQKKWMPSDLKVRLIQVFGAVISGSQHNALKAITPATLDVLLTVLGTYQGEKPTNEQRLDMSELKNVVLKCMIRMVHVIHCCSPDQRQVEVSQVMKGYMQVLLEAESETEHKADTQMQLHMIGAINEMLTCQDKTALQVILVCGGTFNSFISLLQKTNELTVILKWQGQDLVFVPGQIVHIDCRKRFCHPNQLHTEKSTPNSLSSPKTRQSSSRNKFDFETKCLFCGFDAKYKDGKRGNDIHPVTTLEFEISIREACKSRGDEWGDSVFGRLESAHDLPAVEARYHQACSTNFRSGYNVPKLYMYESVKPKKGRPSKKTTDEAFSQLMKYFEDHESEQMTVNDLVERMNELCGELSYSTVYMKKKILEHFGDSVVITELNGKHNVVTFKSTAHSILHSFYKRSNTNDSDCEKKAIVKTASKLILNEIKNMSDISKEEYPSSADIMSTESNYNFLPEGLQCFLKQLIDSSNCDRKIASIGQAIVQAAAPRRAISPLQIGLGVQMHHHFGSKFLIETLNSLGFCSSYHEVQRFEQSAAVSQGIEIEKSNDQFVQFIGDNVDHNIGTIDGLNTFHGMGIIAAITPKQERRHIIPRIKTTSEDIIAVGKIDIHFYKQQTNQMELMIFQKLSTMDEFEDPLEELNFLIKVARPLKPELPSWSGIMQLVQTGDFPGMSSVMFMRMIDMNPSDMSCIYSTLTFIARQARALSTTPVVTFDQPLFWKALNIVINEPDGSDVKHVIVRLGGFHTEMSFLGCIGKLMENTGLTELLSTVYAPNAVGHMLSGKAIGRAVRGHFLVNDALETLLVEKSFPDMQQTVDENNNNCVEELMDNIIKKDTNPETLCDNQMVANMMHQYDNTKHSLTQYRTSKLWLQYMEMIGILQQFIAAERMGNWRGHLKALQHMLPFFASAGHNLYLKTSYIYLQQMLKLEQTNPDIYQQFSDGKHVVRRSDRYWAGLSTDLVIEQVLMRSAKSVGGMTRGRGMSEAQRAQWLLSMPSCSEVNSAMQDFTGQTYETSAQHKDCSKSRVQHDKKDRTTFLEVLREQNPFLDEPCLRNIETGALAESNVNVDSAKTIGQNIVNEMEKKNVLSYSFKRTHQAVTLGSKNNLKVGGEELSVDPQLLFQRLITAADYTIDDTETLFSYELCANPSSIFDSSGLLREAQKPLLANGIWELGTCGVDIIPGEPDVVLDGGSLLHRLPWTFGSSFGEICTQYTNMVEQKYGQAHVVFDGYVNGPSIKDITHQRRSKGATGIRILFNENTPFKTKKDKFLLNPNNKQSFIDLLSTYLTNKGCHVLNAANDADLLIVQTAVEISNDKPVVVVGEDTDLLVLLCYHASMNKERIYLKSDTKTGLKKKKIWDITETKRVLGSDMCHILPFVHAFTGCDTTSRIYGIGKGVVLKKAVKNSNFKTQAEVFMNTSSPTDIETAGENAFKCVYNGKTNEDLDALRFRKFVQKVNISKVVVQVQTLPPTKSAARYHSLRTYFQVQTWLGNDLNPLDWGWRKQDDMMTPVKCDMCAAPERLLKVVRCNCKHGCDTKRCSCRKHGLNCTGCCGECKGTSCSNVQSFIEELDS